MLKQKESKKTYTIQTIPDWHGVQEPPPPVLSTLPVENKENTKQRVFYIWSLLRWFLQKISLLYKLSVGYLKQSLKFAAPYLQSQKIKFGSIKQAI